MIIKKEVASKNYLFGKREFDFSYPFVMGILNVTPDSFSDGEKYFSVSAALGYVSEMIKDGADIIDIGGESSRPGSEPISVDEELNRVIPVLYSVRNKYPEIIISVDTTKYEVALEALKNGAHIINDISGLTFEDRIAGVVSEFNAGLILMHIKGTPKTMQVHPEYENLIYEIKNFLLTQINKAEERGVTKIIIDPGIGFGKKFNNNFIILNQLQEICEIGYPVLIGVSRKSFIGNELNLKVNERDVPTAILETAAIHNGARIIRTHNVKYGVYVRNLMTNLISTV